MWAILENVFHLPCISKIIYYMNTVRDVHTHNAIVSKYSAVKKSLSAPDLVHFHSAEWSCRAWNWRNLRAEDRKNKQTCLRYFSKWVLRCTRLLSRKQCRFWESPAAGPVLRHIQWTERCSRCTCASSPGGPCSAGTTAGSKQPPSWLRQKHKAPRFICIWSLEMHTQREYNQWDSYWASIWSTAI